MRQVAALAAVVVISLFSASAWGQTRAGSEFQVNTYTTNDQSDPSVASDANGNFVVAWQSYKQDRSNYGVFSQRFSSSGAALGTEFQVNTYTTAFQSHPSIAADGDGGFVVAWQSYTQDGSSYGVFGQRFASSGAALGTEFQVNTYTTNFQNHPSVASDTNGDFVVVWQSSNQDGSNDGVFGQRFSSGGAALGTEFQVNTYTTGDQKNPNVASDVNGNFVVVWQSYDADSDGVFGKRFSSSGAVLGTEFQVNTYTTGDQKYPKVASDVNGNFVVMWQSQPLDGDSYGIFGKRFSSSGAALGTEFQVNTYTTGDQKYPSVASDMNGDFVVVWTSFNAHDGSSSGVFGRRFSSSGAALGTEFQVNTYTTNFQGIPAITADGDGDFVVAWQSYRQDGSNNGVFGQRFQGFDVCLQDDRTGSVLQFSSTGGSYQFCCKPQKGTLTGTGVVSINGCRTRLTDSTAVLVAEVNTCTKQGSASIKTKNRALQCSIIDKNTTDNTCTCP